MSTPESIRDDAEAWKAEQKEKFEESEGDFSPKMVALACRMSDRGFNRKELSLTEKLKREFLAGWEACEYYNRIGEDDDK